MPLSSWSTAAAAAAVGVSLTTDAAGSGASFLFSFISSARRRPVRGVHTLTGLAARSSNGNGSVGSECSRHTIAAGRGAKRRGRTALTTSRAWTDTGDSVRAVDFPIS